MASVLGRSEETFPDLGDLAGATQVNQQQTSITNMSNHLIGRFKTASAVADSTLTAFRHNFGNDFSELSVKIYTGTHPTLTRVADPVAAGWVIAAGTPAKEEIDITTPGSGGPHTFAVLILQVKGVENLGDIDNVDLTGLAIGETVVWDGSNFVAGASGDSSWKPVEFTATDVLSISGGSLVSDGKRYVTHDGADPLANMSVNLKTEVSTLGIIAPAINTTYHLYIDLASLVVADDITLPTPNATAAAVKVEKGTTGALTVLTTDQDSSTDRYIYLMAIRTDGSGNYTEFFRRPPLVNVSPAQVVLTSKIATVVDDVTIGAVGSSGQIRAGHQLVDDSFPTGVTKYYWGFTADGGRGLVDLSGNGKDMVVRSGTFPFTDTDLDGTATNAGAATDDSTILSAHDPVFDRGNSDTSAGIWALLDDFTPGGTDQIFQVRDTVVGATQQWGMNLTAAGLLTLEAIGGGGNVTYNIDTDPSGLGLDATKWLHMGMTFRASDGLLTLYINGVVAASGTGRSFSANTGGTMALHCIGLEGAAGVMPGGTFQEAYYVEAHVSDADMKRLVGFKHPLTGPALNVGQANMVFQGNRSDSTGDIVSPIDLSAELIGASNAVYTLFSGADTDKASLDLYDSGVGGNLVSTRRFNRRFTTDISTTSIAHGLSDVPASVRVMQFDDGNSSWLELGEGNILSKDATNLIIGTDVFAVVPSALNPIQISASVEPVAVAAAETTDTLPTYDTSDADIVMDGTSFHVIVQGITASRNIDLPSVADKGKELIIENDANGFDLVIRSSGANPLTKADSVHDGAIRTGRVLVRSKQALPTTAAHWEVVSIRESFTQAVGTAGEFDDGLQNWLFTRDNHDVHVSADDRLTHSLTGNATDGGAVITRLRPTFTGHNYSNAFGNVGTVILLMELDTSGGLHSLYSSGSRNDSARIPHIFWSINN